MTATATNPLNVDSQRTRRRYTFPAVFKNWLFRVGAAIVIVLGLLALKPRRDTVWASRSRRRSTRYATGEPLNAKAFAEDLKAR